MMAGASRRIIAHLPSDKNFLLEWPKAKICNRNYLRPTVARTVK